MVEAPSSSGPSVSEPTSDADVRRAEIVDRAATLFDQRGYDRTSMNDIASACGLRKSTLYHYFTTKDEILFWIHEGFINPLLANQEQWEAESLGPGEFLCATIRDILILMQTRRGHVRAFFEHHRELAPDRRAVSLAKRELYRSRVEAVIRAGIADGSFRPVDPKFATFALFGMVNWTYQWFEPRGERSVDETVAAFFDVVMNGLATSRR